MIKIKKKTEKEIKTTGTRWAPVAHPSYSGGKDQEDLGWKPALTNSS
jgi:hypothetical protein